MFTSAPAFRLWEALRGVGRAVEGRLERHLAAHGVTRSECAVLEELARRGALPIGELGQRVFLTSGSMTYLIDKLERRGLLRRRPSEDDRRVILAEPTEAARSLVARLAPEQDSLLALVFGALSAEEQEVLITLLHRLDAREPVHRQTESAGAGA